MNYFCQHKLEIVFHIWLSVNLHPRKQIPTWLNKSTVREI
jgi:hypothetical protein